MKILFVSTRQAKPSFRFRVEQILPFYQARGHECTIAFLPSALWKRFALYRQMKEFDVVVIQKRLLSRAELTIVRRRAARLVYDIDDAVMFNGAGVAEGKRQTRFKATVRAADVTICGNGYLAEHARRFTKNVVVVPTPIDSIRFSPPARHEEKSELIIGWTGSRSTNRYLDAIFHVLTQLPRTVAVKVISDTTDGLDFTQLGQVRHTFVPWSPDVEISEAATFDIGLMPLPDDPWARGKCGFKALQYMSLGIPALCSPVGVNTEIVSDGKNGFLPNTPVEWHKRLSQLIADSSLRDRIGSAARRRIEADYALDVLGPRFEEHVTAISRTHSRSA